MLLQKHWFYLKEGFLSLSALDIFRGGAGAGSVLCAVGLPGLYSLDPVAPTTPFTLELWQPTCFQTAPCPAGEQNKSASVEDHCYIKHLEAWFSCLAPSPKLDYKCSGGGWGIEHWYFGWFFSITRVENHQLRWSSGSGVVPLSSVGLISLCLLSSVFT